MTPAWWQRLAYALAATAVCLAVGILVARRSSWLLGLPLALALAYAAGWHGDRIVTRIRADLRALRDGRDGGKLSR